MLKHRDGEPRRPQRPRRPGTETWSLLLFLLATALTIAVPWLVGLTPGPTSAAAFMLMVGPLVLGLAGARLALETRSIPLVLLNTAAAFLFMPIASVIVNMTAGA